MVAKICLITLSLIPYPILCSQSVKLVLWVFLFIIWVVALLVLPRSWTELGVPSKTKGLERRIFPLVAVTRSSNARFSSFPPVLLYVDSYFVYVSTWTFFSHFFPSSYRVNKFNINEYEHEFWSDLILLHVISYKIIGWLNNVI